MHPYMSTDPSSRRETDVHRQPCMAIWPASHQLTHWPSQATRILSTRSADVWGTVYISCLVKVNDCQITFCMLSYHHHPQHHSTTISDTAHTHSSCLNTPHTYQTATSLHGCCTKTPIRPRYFVMLTLLDSDMRSNMPVIRILTFTNIDLIDWYNITRAAVTG